MKTKKQTDSYVVVVHKKKPIEKKELIVDYEKELLKLLKMLGTGIPVKSFDFELFFNVFDAGEGSLYDDVSYRGALRRIKDTSILLEILAIVSNIDYNRYKAENIHNVCKSDLINNDLKRILFYNMYMSHKENLAYEYLSFKKQFKKLLS